MSYAAGRTDGKEPCKQSQHCLGSWKGDMDKNNREPYGTSQRSTIKIFKSRGQRKLQSYRAMCLSYSLLFWYSSGSSQLMGDGEESNVSGGKSEGIPQGVLLSKLCATWWSLPVQRFSILGKWVSGRFMWPLNSYLGLPIDFPHVPPKWTVFPIIERSLKLAASQNVQLRLNRGILLYLHVSSE